MSKHRTETIRSTEQLIADRIRDRVVDLTEPHAEKVEQWARSADGARLEPVRTTIEHPSLLGQLRAGVTGGTQGLSTSGYGSKPATNLNPIATLEDITRASAWLVESIDRRRAARADLRTSVVARLWFLADRAPTLERDDLVFVDATVTSWWVRARITTTWGDPPLKPHVPCSECGQRGGVQVVLYPTAATCTGCGAVWDGSTIGVLGEHVRLLLEPTVDVIVRAERQLAADVGLPVERDTLPAMLRGVVPTT